MRLMLWLVALTAAAWAGGVLEPCPPRDHCCHATTSNDYPYYDSGYSYPVPQASPRPDFATLARRFKLNPNARPLKPGHRYGLGHYPKNIPSSR